MENLKDPTMHSANSLMNILAWLSVTVTILAITIILGRFYPPQLLAAFGLGCTFLGLSASFVAAYTASRRARKVEHMSPKDFLPQEPAPSATFVDESGIMGQPPPSLDSLSARLDQLKSRVNILHSTTEKRFAFSDRRHDAILAVLRHQREVLIPLAAASTSRYVYFSCWLTLYGAVLLAFPIWISQVISEVSNSAIYVFGELHRVLWL
jgi:hypothetical protein